MRLKLRMHRPEFLSMVGSAIETPWPALASYACVRNDVQDGEREYVVLPRRTGQNADSSRVPVYVHAPEALHRSRQSNLFELQWPDAEPPYLIVDAENPSAPTAILQQSRDRQIRIPDIKMIDLHALPVNRPGADRPRPSDYELEHGRFSRTIGALSGDFRALHKMQAARICIVGAGRAGTGLALGLVEGFGAGNPGSIVLIDDDLVEASGLDSGMDQSFVGRRKVDALADLIKLRSPDANVRPVFAPAESVAAFRAMASSDAILVGVDSASARVAAAICAAAYYVPLIDVGAAVLPDRRRRRRRARPGGSGEAAGVPWIAGADVRITGPGSCLLCCGGINEIGAPRRRSFRSHRLGSLRSLSMISCGIGINMLLVLLTSPVAVRASRVWMELTAWGNVRANTIDIMVPIPGCPICQVWTGRADELLHQGPGGEDSRASGARMIQEPGGARDDDLPF